MFTISLKRGRRGAVVQHLTVNAQVVLLCIYYILREMRGTGRWNATLSFVTQHLENLVERMEKRLNILLLLAPFFIYNIFIL